MPEKDGMYIELDIFSDELHFSVSSIVRIMRVEMRSVCSPHLTSKENRIKK